jgi:hypothetical protein
MQHHCMMRGSGRPGAFLSRDRHPVQIVGILPWRRFRWPFPPSLSGLYSVSIAILPHPPSPRPPQRMCFRGRDPSPIPSKRDKLTATQCYLASGEWPGAPYVAAACAWPAAHRRGRRMSTRMPPAGCRSSCESDEPKVDSWSTPARYFASALQRGANCLEKIGGDRPLYSVRRLGTLAP